MKFSHFAAAAALIAVGVFSASANAQQGLLISRAIDGKVYNTVRAEQVADITEIIAGLQSDARIELFRSYRGQWFVAGQGGNCAKWGKQFPAALSVTKRCEGLYLVSDKEALDLLFNARHDYKRHFTDVDG